MDDDDDELFFIGLGAGRGKATLIAQADPFIIADDWDLDDDLKDDDEEDDYCGDDDEEDDYCGDGDEEYDDPEDDYEDWNLAWGFHNDQCDWYNWDEDEEDEERRPAPKEKKATRESFLRHGVVCGVPTAALISVADGIWPAPKTEPRELTVRELIDSYIGNVHYESDDIQDDYRWNEHGAFDNIQDDYSWNVHDEFDDIRDAFLRFGIVHGIPTSALLAASDRIWAGPKTDDESASEAFQSRGVAPVVTRFLSGADDDSDTELEEALVSQLTAADEAKSGDWLDERIVGLKDQYNFCLCLQISLDHDHQYDREIGGNPYDLDLDEKLRLHERLDELAKYAREATDALSRHLYQVGDEPFARNLKAIREQQNRRWNWVAERLDTTAQEIWSWESGLTVPSYTQLPRLAKVLGVTTDDLLKDCKDEEDEE